MHAGVVDDVRELPCLVTRVHWHRHRADPHRAEEHRERLDPVGVEQADALAVRDARGDEAPRHRPRQRRELGRRGTLVGHHDPAAQELGCAVDQRRRS